ncbi:PREDICTED: caspase-like [Polistes canadensis]|uniref:caspase-like n=1 Tax=Polistes canadensis TaxID=91411 RepID=UPI000718FAB4|nr:PREDICTED: caspase-like [Polistes canadensis]
MDKASTSQSTDHCDTAATKSLKNEIDVKLKYPILRKKRNCALIFCHEVFDGNIEVKRVGVEQDCNRLKSILQTFNFEVVIYKDLKRSKIFDTLSKVSQMDHSDKDCLLIVVLTHGNSGILCACDHPYDIIDLWNPFSENNCPSLKGKPKLFFIQACRGDDVDSGTELQFEEYTQLKQRVSSEISLPDAGAYKLSPKELKALRTPDEQDFLIGYSTAPDYVSYKTECGSWYIEEIYTIFQRYGKHYDLLTLLTFVSQRVAVNYVTEKSIDPKYEDKKQAPCIVSTLTKLLYFFPEEAEEIPKDLELEPV